MFKSFVLYKIMINVRGAFMCKRIHPESLVFPMQVLD